MKHPLALVLLSFLCMPFFGQTQKFWYDASGNRTSRKTIGLKSESGIIDDKNTPEKFSDQVGEKEILIYPNPVRSHLTIEINGYEEGINAGFYVIDQGGRQIINQNRATQSTTLDLSEFPPGVYFLLIKVGNERSKWTIIKE